MRFKDLYLEAKQVGTLYHFTSIGSLFNILETNTLKSNEYETLKDASKKVYGSSFTRNKKANLLIADDNKLTSIVVDGDKLSNNYKIIPRDEFYFNKSSKRSEAEEFVQGTVKDFKKYIKEIFLIKESIIDIMLKKTPIKYYKLYIGEYIPYTIESKKEFLDIYKRLQDETGIKLDDALQDLIEFYAKEIRERYNLKVSVIESL